jgi:RimJ/RimL family protein N-acetyltransferase
MMNGRLVSLRPVEEGDLGFLTALANDSRVRSMVVGWDWPVAGAGQQAWLAGLTKDPRSVRLTVLDQQSQAPIGLTGLWEVDWHNRSAVTAIKLMPGVSPKGAGSDAIMLVDAWAFYEVGLRRLHTTILDFNGPSIGAYVRRCGWRIEGRERQSVFRRGEWCDLYHVALLRSDFVGHEAAAEYVRYVCDADVTDKVAVTVGDWRPDQQGPMPSTRLGMPIQ